MREARGAQLGLFSKGCRKARMRCLFLNHIIFSICIYVEYRCASNEVRARDRDAVFALALY